MRLQIVCNNKLQVTSKILTTLECYHIEILSSYIDEHIYFEVKDLSFDILSSLMTLIRKIEDVIDIRVVTMMPFEYSNHILSYFLKTSLEVIFAIDAKGKILLLNRSALIALKQPKKNVVNSSIEKWVQNFNFSRWIVSPIIRAQTVSVVINELTYNAKLLPIYQEENLVGAVASLTVDASEPLNVSDFNEIYAPDNKMQKIVLSLAKYAKKDTPLVLTGEHGVGKELLATICHNASDFSELDLVKLNCINLQCSALKEVVDNLKGTLVLIDIDLLSLECQNYLVKNLKARLIATTKENLQQLLVEKRFNQGLFYMLNNINIPPLRQRKQTVLGLANLFLAAFAKQHDIKAKSLDLESVELLLNYSWPGNISQLKSVLYTAFINCTSDKVTINSKLLPFNEDKIITKNLSDMVKTYEAVILRDLYPVYPSTRQLGQKLGLSHTAIANKLREYKIR